MVTVQDPNLVVVVDDDPGMLNSIGHLLEAYGFDIKLFPSAEAFKEQGECAGAVCFILDINLPGMSGIELQRELLSKSRTSVPVIFITGNDSEATFRSVAELGCIACLSKPFRAPALLEAVNKAIGRQN